MILNLYVPQEMIRQWVGDGVERVGEKNNNGLKFSSDSLIIHGQPSGSNGKHSKSSGCGIKSQIINRIVYGSRWQNGIT